MRMQGRMSVCVSVCPDSSSTKLLLMEGLDENFVGNLSSIYCKFFDAHYDQMFSCIKCFTLCFLVCVDLRASFSNILCFISQQLLAGCSGSYWGFRGCGFLILVIAVQESRTTTGKETFLRVQLIISGL